MVTAIPLLLSLPLAYMPEGGPAIAPPPVTENWAVTPDARFEHFLPVLRERSKKELWRLEKANRPDVRVTNSQLLSRRGAEPRARAGSPCAQAEAKLATTSAGVGARLEPVTTLYSIWNREAIPLIPGEPYRGRFQYLLRDHFTKQATQADVRLVGILAASAIRFRAPRIEIVSGYRSPKYNMILRKKGHQVARESQHLQGAAVDFRIRGVATEVLSEFVRSLRVGGVGYYPKTRFIHADTGKVRYWKGS